MVLSLRKEYYIHSYRRAGTTAGFIPKAELAKFPNLLLGQVVVSQRSIAVKLTTEFHTVLVLTMWGLYALSFHETETAGAGREIQVLGSAGHWKQGLCHQKAKEGRPLELGWQSWVRGVGSHESGSLGQNGFGDCLCGINKRVGRKCIRGE